MRSVLKFNLATRTSITAATLRAYRETEYHVGGDRPFVLRIGEFSPQLQAGHERFGVCCSGFLTAWNPGSEPADEADNRRRQRALRRTLQGFGLYFCDGIGVHPSNDWPGEESVLVWGLSLGTARRIGRRFEQNAVVWSNAGAIPQLILLR